jgi:uncharacterized membrane protein YqiK
MSSGPDWIWWIVAVLVAALFGWFFWHTATTMFGALRTLVTTVQNWPQTRRAMVEAEARAGGRYPFWYRAIRVTLVLAMIGLVGYLVWRKFS